MTFAFLSNLIAPLFYKLLFMSLTALVIGMIIMLIRRFADKRFSPIWKYAMWGLVLVALILPWRPQSNISLMNVTGKVWDVSFHDEYQMAQAEYETIKQNNLKQNPVDYSSTANTEILAEAKAKAEALHLNTIVFDNILPALWICGMIAVGFFMLISRLQLERKIKNSTIPFELSGCENTLQNCKQKLGIKHSIPIIKQSHVKTPALFGLFRPQIILPEYVENLDDTYLEFIILHELFHLKRGDHFINTLLLVLQVIYCFNPLIWILFKFIREDMEIANDASVLRGMDSEQQKEYSLSIVEVLARYRKVELSPRLLCMVDNEKNMKRRINMIKMGEFFKKRRLVISVSGLLSIVIISALFLTTGRTNMDTNKLETTEDIIDKIQGLDDLKTSSNGISQVIQTPKFISLSKAASILKARPITSPWEIYYASAEYVYIAYEYGRELIFRYNIKDNRIDKALHVNPENILEWSVGATFYLDGKRSYIYPGIPEIYDTPQPNRSVYLVNFESEEIEMISNDSGEFTLPTNIKYYQRLGGDSVYGDTAKKYGELAEKDKRLPQFPSDWCNIIEIEQDTYVIIMPSDADNAWPGNGYSYFKIIHVNTNDVKSMGVYEIQDLT